MDIISLNIKKATTSRIIQIPIGDSSVTTGAGLTGLVYNSAGLKAYYLREGDTSPTAITLVTATVGTFTSSGFKEVDATNMAGLYEIGVPDACLADGAENCVIIFQGATNMRPMMVNIRLLDSYQTGAVVTDVANGVSQFKTDLTETIDSVHKDKFLLFKTGVLSKQVKRVSSFNGSTKFIGVSAPFTAVPSPGDTFELLNA